jgi:hypothetical protein
VDKAKTLNIEIITEDEFYKMVQELNTPHVTSTKLSSTHDINGKTVDLDTLTLDNYLDKTGQRFRMEKWDKQNGTGRQEAFDNMIERFRNAESAV